VYVQKISRLRIESSWCSLTCRACENLVLPSLKLLHRACIRWMRALILLRAGCSFHSLNLGFSPSQIDFLVDVFDMDKSKSIDYGEFCTTMQLTDNQIIGAQSRAASMCVPPCAHTIFKTKYMRMCSGHSRQCFLLCFWLQRVSEWNRVEGPNWLTRFCSDPLSQE
jgi:hypothetical protein